MKKNSVTEYVYSWKWFVPLSIVIISIACYHDMAKDRYEQKGKFYYGVAPATLEPSPVVNKENKNMYCYINEKYKKVSDYYDYTAEFQDGFGLVKKDGKYGFVNPSGRKVFEWYDFACSFCDNVAYVSQGKKSFFIDKDGHPLDNDYWISIPTINKDSVIVMEFKAGGKFISSYKKSFQERPTSSMCGYN